jgi:hypothetical protein
MTPTGVMYMDSGKFLLCRSTKSHQLMATKKKKAAGRTTGYNMHVITHEVMGPLLDGEDFLTAVMSGYRHSLKILGFFAIEHPEPEDLFPDQEWFSSTAIKAEFDGRSARTSIEKLFRCEIRQYKSGAEWDDPETPADKNHTKETLYAGSYEDIMKIFRKKVEELLPRFE